MTVRFAVVHEAVADFVTATELADRVLVEAIDWLDEQLLVYQRTWLGESRERHRLSWKEMKRLAHDAGIRVRGHFNGEPGQADAAAARRAILFLRQEFSELDAIVLIGDQDDQPERRHGLKQARQQHHGGIAIVVGLAVVERECWIICGFDPQDDPESARLQAEKARLGFDPRMRSHELTACKNNIAPRSPKRVLRALAESDRERERDCWCKTALTILRERGSANGLAEYLEEVRGQLAVLIGKASTQ